MDVAPEKIVSLVVDVKKILILSHINPDGDALGSMLGLCGLLEKMNKDVLCYSDDSVSDLYDFLPGCEKIVSDFRIVENFLADDKDGVLQISLDCGDSSRLGKNEDFFLSNHPMMVVDHHKGHRVYGDFNWIKPGLSSVGEMVYELSELLPVSLDYNDAFNLYTAIATDTGFFCYSSTTATTLNIAADLVNYGVRPEDVCTLVNDNFSLARMELLKLVLETMDVCSDGTLAFVHVTKNMIKKTGANDHDIDGFINYPRKIKTVLVAVFVKEVSDDQLSVSLRSKGDIDVAKIAAKFGGGGHRNAAGFRTSKYNMGGIKKEIVDLYESVKLVGK